MVVLGSSSKAVWQKCCGEEVPELCIAEEKIAGKVLSPAKEESCSEWKSIPVKPQVSRSTTADSAEYNSLFSKRTKQRIFQSVEALATYFWDDRHGPFQSSTPCVLRGIPEVRQDALQLSPEFFLENGDDRSQKPPSPKGASTTRGVGREEKPNQCYQSPVAVEHKHGNGGEKPSMIWSSSDYKKKQSPVEVIPKINGRSRGVIFNGDDVHCETDHHDDDHDDHDHDPQREDGSECQGRLLKTTSRVFLPGDVRVSVHVSNSPSLDFIRRNFVYEWMTLRELIEQIHEASERSDVGLPDSRGKQYFYYRSLGSPPNKRRSHLHDIHPGIARAVRLPACLCPITQTHIRSRQVVEPKQPRGTTEVPDDDAKQQPTSTDATDARGPQDPPALRYHSSVLRISQMGLQLWLHYDIPDNFLIQIRGFKKVVLFPPSQVQNLYVVGSSSRVPNVASEEFDKSEYPLMREAYRHRQVCHLLPGDILFIPSCWFHAIQTQRESGAAASTGDVVSVSANVFFDNLLDGKLRHYDSKDIYGNKDLTVAQRVASTVSRSLLPALRDLPPPYGSFYLRKLAGDLLAEAELLDPRNSLNQPNCFYE